MSDIGWGDVFVDDYMLVEMQVSRVYTPDHTWTIRYSLLAATRLASTP